MSTHYVPRTVLDTLGYTIDSMTIFDHFLCAEHCCRYWGYPREQI